MWQIKTFEQLNTSELYQIMRLRVAVFVVEQNCPYYELDDEDLRCHHVFYTDKNAKISAYSRIFRQENHITFGRVVVLPECRGSGLGKRLVQEVMTFIRATYPEKTIVIEAQQYVIPFYEAFGFKSVGGLFDLDGISHQKMQCDSF